MMCLICISPPPVLGGLVVAIILLLPAVVAVVTIPMSPSAIHWTLHVMQHQVMSFALTVQFSYAAPRHLVRIICISLPPVLGRVVMTVLLLPAVVAVVIIPGLLPAHRHMRPARHPNVLRQPVA
jgi:hypothetical protein